MIGHNGAGLLGDQGGGGHIPVALRSQGNGKVGLAGGDAGHTVGHGRPGVDIQARPGFRPDVLAEQTGIAKHFGIFQLVALAGVDGLSV